MWSASTNWLAGPRAPVPLSLVTAAARVRSTDGMRQGDAARSFVRGSHISSVDAPCKVSDNPSRTLPRRRTDLRRGPGRVPRAPAHHLGDGPPPDPRQQKPTNAPPPCSIPSRCAGRPENGGNGREASNICGHRPPNQVAAWRRLTIAHSSTSKRGARSAGYSHELFGDA